MTKNDLIEKRLWYLMLPDDEKDKYCVFCGNEFVPPVCGHINCGGLLLDVTNGDLIYRLITEVRKLRLELETK